MTKPLSDDILEVGHGGLPQRRSSQVAAGVASARPSRTILPKGARLIKDDDVAWMVELASRRYPPEFDLLAAEQWMRQIVLKQPMMFLAIRTDNAFIVCLIAVIPWLPSNWEANAIMVCAEEGCAWDVMGLLRFSIEWAKKRKCVEWRMRTETAYDLGPMAKRLGAGVLPPCYVVRLDGST